MIGRELATDLDGLRLIAPDIARDAPKGVEWLKGAVGRETLGLMGVNDANNQETTLDIEKDRITQMIESEDELAWMLENDDVVVGVIEVRLKDDKDIPAPNVSTMIGDVTARGRGMGTAAKRSVIDYMFTAQGATRLYSRHLTRNKISRAGLITLGFEDCGEIYRDADGLEWQNLVLHKEPNA